LLRGSHCLLPLAGLPMAVDVARLVAYSSGELSFNAV
jgi:hypothetical protein